MHIIWAKPQDVINLECIVSNVIVLVPTTADTELVILKTGLVLDGLLIILKHNITHLNIREYDC